MRFYHQSIINGNFKPWCFYNEKKPTEHIIQDFESKYSKGRLYSILVGIIYISQVESECFSIGEKSVQEIRC